MIEVKNEDELRRLLGLMNSSNRKDYRYLSKPRARVCRLCGEVFETLGRGRPKKFCSEDCRKKYNNNHPNIEKWKTARMTVCPQCGKEFMVAREYGRMRKYCSRACANKGRATERRKQNAGNNK